MVNKVRPSTSRLPLHHPHLVSKLRAESERVLTLERELHQTSEDLRTEKISKQNTETTMTLAQKAAKESEMSTRELEATLDSVSRESNLRQERCQLMEREKAKLEERVREMQILLSQPASSNAPSRKPSHRPRSSSLSNFRISTLETDMNETRAALEQREKEKEILSKKLAAAQSEANRLSNEKAALEKKSTIRIHELEESLAEREDELAYWRESGAGQGREEELMARIEEDEAKLASLQAELQDESQRCRKLNQQHTRLKAEYETLVGDLDDARSQIQTLELVVKERRGRPSLAMFVPILTPADT